MELLNGFSNLKDIVNERVVGDKIPVVTDAIDQAIAEHNKVTDDMMSLFVTKTTDHSLRYKSPGAANLQPLDEYGRARKIKAAGHYDVAFPLRDAGAALGDTRIALAKQTVQDVNDKIALLLDADKRWLRDNILSALFNDTGYTFSDDEYGDLSVVPLANGDSTVYLVRAGNEAGETADHYRFITAMDNTNQSFATIYRDLTKRPENFGNGEVISLIPTNLEDDVMALSEFIEADDPDIRASISRDQLVGRLGVSVPGIVIGKVNKNWIVRWDALPDDYIISTITSGNRSLAMREHPETELRGFNRVATRDDDPYYESQFVRSAGFGGYNRVGTIITKVGVSYTVPTGFTVPQAS